MSSAVNPHYFLYLGCVHPFWTTLAQSPAARRQAAPGYGGGLAGKVCIKQRFPRDSHWRRPNQNWPAAYAADWRRRRGAPLFCRFTPAKPPPTSLAALRRSVRWKQKVSYAAGQAIRCEHA
jgi:hypothetical protein